MFSIPDKTAGAQARLLYDIVVEELQYYPERVMWVLSDNTASVLAENSV